MNKRKELIFHLHIMNNYITTIIYEQYGKTFHCKREVWEMFRNHVRSVNKNMLMVISKYLYIHI